MTLKCWDSFEITPLILTELSAIERKWNRLEWLIGGALCLRSRCRLVLNSNLGLECALQELHTSACEGLKDGEENR